jgi:hypothetical protein
LQHGLLQSSFVPPTDIQDLRDLTRYRVELTQAQSRVANRIQKVLEQANIKLSSVASDTLGVSGQLMIEAIIDGEDNPEHLADLAKRRLRQRIPDLQLALQRTLVLSADHLCWNCVGFQRNLRPPQNALLILVVLKSTFKRLPSTGRQKVRGSRIPQPASSNFIPRACPFQQRLQTDKRAGVPEGDVVDLRTARF